MNGTVLVVEDDELLGSSLCRALDASGYATRRASSLAAARESFDAVGPDVVLLDLSLPDGDGLSWCAELQTSHPTLPVMLLTARAAEIDVVIGLSAGAVDYVTKPFRLAELLARIDAHLRTAKARGEAAVPGQQRCVGDVRLDVRSRRAWVADTEIELRAREFDLLAKLLAEVGNVVRREDLMSELWDEHWFGSTKTLDVHVSHLRRRLGEEPGGPSRIVSVRGVGYRFEPAP